MSEETILGIVFVILGVVMILVGVLFGVLYLKKKKSCSETVVADIVSRAVQEGRTEYNDGTMRSVNYYYWCYEYKWNGQTYYQTSSYGITGGRRKVKQMTLYINPSDPEEFLEKRFMAHLVELICCAIGLFFALIGIIFV